MLTAFARLIDLSSRVLTLSVEPNSLSVVPNDRVWKRRIEMGLSQMQLAKNAGLRQAEVSQIEREGWIPPSDVRDALAAALNTTAAELFAGDQAVAQ